MDPKLERILLRVQKPARYTGGEYNEIIKDKAAVDTRFAFCFPDTYEIGMSNLGLRILYGVINEM
ncbi:MAG: B12-binding domain-containing radical SAM protein, partial [Clostridiales bacterium]|nr:B12-binding domain-containing radical SAM protein [Clostridiales bacterium]